MDQNTRSEQITRIEEACQQVSSTATGTFADIMRVMDRCEEVIGDPSALHRQRCMLVGLWKFADDRLVAQGEACISYIIDKCIAEALV